MWEFLVLSRLFNYKRTMLNQMLNIITGEHRSKILHNHDKVAIHWWRELPTRNRTHKRTSSDKTKSEEIMSKSILMRLQPFARIQVSISGSCFSFSLSISMAFVTCVFACFFFMLIHFFLFCFAPCDLVEVAWHAQRFEFTCLAHTVQLLPASGMRACCLFSDH